VASTSFHSVDSYRVPLTTVPNDSKPLCRPVTYDQASLSLPTFPASICVSGLKRQPL